MSDQQGAAPGWVRSRARHWQYSPPLKTSFAVTAILFTVIVVVVYLQFRGDFTPKTRLTLMSPRAGLVMDPGSKVTYNGVEIGRVTGVDAVERDGTTQAKLSLDVNPKYVERLLDSKGGSTSTDSSA